MGISSSDTAVKLVVNGVSVGVEHHGGQGNSPRGVSSGDMALEMVVDGVLQWGWGWGCVYA